jgi:hypothetical protein
MDAAGQWFKIADIESIGVMEAIPACHVKRMVRIQERDNFISVS